MGRKILFVTTDQQRYDALGCNGNTIARTPVIDRLAAEGIVYRRAYNQNTVCMPARSTMLTGQYVRTHGVVANGIPLPTDAPSVAAHLSEQAGYRTALLGKAHFEPGFDLDGRCGETRPKEAWRHWPVARFSSAAINTVHPPRVRTHSDGLEPGPGPLRALAPGAPPRAPHELRPAPRGTRRRRHRRAGDEEQPDPAGLVPHRLDRGPRRRLARHPPRRRGLVLLDELPGPAPPVGPAGVRSRAEAPGGTSTSSAAPPPAPPTPSATSSTGGPAHWLAWWQGRSWPNTEGGPRSFVPSRLDRRPDPPRDQRAWPT